MEGILFGLNPYPDHRAWLAPNAPAPSPSNPVAVAPGAAASTTNRVSIGLAGKRTWVNPALSASHNPNSMSPELPIASILQTGRGPSHLPQSRPSVPRVPGSHLAPGSEPLRGSLGGRGAGARASSPLAPLAATLCLAKAGGVGGRGRWSGGRSAGRSAGGRGEGNPGPGGSASRGKGLTWTKAASAVGPLALAEESRSRSALGSVSGSGSAAQGSPLALSVVRQPPMGALGGRGRADKRAGFGRGAGRTEKGAALTRVWVAPSSGLIQRDPAKRVGVEEGAKNRPGSALPARRSPAEGAAAPSGTISSTHSGRTSGGDATGAAVGGLLMKRAALLQSMSSRSSAHMRVWRRQQGCDNRGVGAPSRDSDNATSAASGQGSRSKLLSKVWTRPASGLLVSPRGAGVGAGGRAGTPAAGAAAVLTRALSMARSRLVKVCSMDELRRLALCVVCVLVLNNSDLNVSATESIAMPLDLNGSCGLSHVSP